MNDGKMVRADDDSKQVRVEMEVYRQLNMIKAVIRAGSLSKVIGQLIDSSYPDINDLSQKVKDVEAKRQQEIDQVLNQMRGK